MVKIMENPIKSIKMDDLGVPLFLETPKWRWGDQKYLANQLGRIVDPIGL